MVVMVFSLAGQTKKVWRNINVSEVVIVEKHDVPGQMWVMVNIDTGDASTNWGGIFHLNDSNKNMLNTLMIAMAVDKKVGLYIKEGSGVTYSAGLYTGIPEDDMPMHAIYGVIMLSD